MKNLIISAVLLLSISAYFVGGMNLLVILAAFGLTFLMGAPTILMLCKYGEEVFEPRKIPVNGYRKNYRY